MAKWKRDVIYGVAIIVACVFGVIETQGMRITGNPKWITRPDVYMWLWLAVLGLLAASMIIKALIKKDTTPCAPIWCKDGVFTVVVMFLYLLSMETLGFLISSFLFETILILAYSKRMGKLDYKGKALVWRILLYVAIALITTIATKVLFTRLLSVRLPKGKLF